MESVTVKVNTSLMTPTPGETVRTVYRTTMWTRLERRPSRRTKLLVAALRTVHLELGLLRR